MEELGIAGVIETGKFSTSDLNRDVKTFHSDTDTNNKIDKDNQVFTVSSILWCPDFEDVFLISYANGKVYEKKVENIGRTAN